MCQSEAPQAAQAYFERELVLHPDFWGCRSNLGLIQQKLGHLDAARDNFYQALQDCTESSAQAQILENIGDLEQTRANLQTALKAYQRALQITPRELRLYWKLASSQRRCGQLRAAIQTLHKMLYLAPTHRQGWRQLADWQGAARQFNAAQFSLQQALSASSDPRDKALIALQSAHLFSETGDMQHAADRLSHARTWAPLDGLRLARLCLLPPVYDSFAHLQTVRQTFTDELHQLTQMKLDIQDPATEMGGMPFYLAYQGENDRPLMEKLSALYRTFLPAAPEPPPATQGSRLRLACISRCFYTHSLMHCFGGMLEKLSHERFEMGFFSVAPLLEDAQTERLKHRADHWQHLPTNLSVQRTAIAAWQPDLVLYTDLGPDLSLWLLAHTRLAPVQWVLFGHPVTSGVDTIDGFISQENLDAPTHQTHFSEVLIRLKSFPYWISAPTAPPLRHSRSSLGLPENRHLYLCPVHLFKIHPRMDGVFKSLLEQDPAGIIILLCQPENTLDQRLRQRFQRTIGKVAERIWFLPWLTSADFLDLLRLGDVFLEPFPFGNGTTLFNVLGLGIPIVCLNERFTRGRFACAYYHQMQLSTLITQNEAAYVQQALKWAHEPELRQTIGQQILAAHPALFENQLGISQLEEALWTAHHQAGGRRI